MSLKKILSIFLALSLFANVSFAAFDPYADEEVEKKSYKKLCYGIVLTLLGGFLAYDGFSTEEVDVSKPSVDYITVSHSEWVQIGKTNDNPNPRYEIRSGITLDNVPQSTGEYNKYEIKDEERGDKLYDHIEKNILYNNGNVDLCNITIEVRYKFRDGTYIGDEDGTHVTTGGYHIAQTNHEQGTPTEPVEDKIYGGEGNYITLKKGESITWQDIWSYKTAPGSQEEDEKDKPNGSERKPYVAPTQTTEGDTGTIGLNLGKDSPMLMNVRVKLKKNLQYKPIYETRHKSDIEGVAGVLIGITGIYFIVDHFLDMHKFNAYAKRHHLNLKVATASNEYKLMLQKRI